MKVDTGRQVRIRKPIGQFQAIGFKLADMVTKISAAKMDARERERWGEMDKRRESEREGKGRKLRRILK